ncbi:uncharacterized protein LOC133519310 isoform X2 [Cydia pomonella]|uniref:uncharacterized protein LOC133519310 isoform X2 n=1 Tax=Cydia pomonella TaxID=82600 RepID=UPI002ADE8047|nr:uncharacterized protein LOC133519310 isoform X2 [Cydia pomonella]
MAEAMETGTSLAWRLLATLEGGSLVLVASALLAYSARQRARERRPVHTVLVSNTSSALGKEIKTRLESRGCVVSMPSDASGAEADAGAGKVDALVVVGQDANVESLDGLADLVSRDVYDNLKVLKSLSRHVHRGGCVAWACAGTSGVSGAGDAFDTVLRASLQHVADRHDCSPVWVGRHPTTLAAERVVAALVPCTTHSSAFSVRNAAHKIGEYLGRWLKNLA